MGCGQRKLESHSSTQVAQLPDGTYSCCCFVFFFPPNKGILFSIGCFLNRNTKAMGARVAYGTGWP